MSRLKRGFRKVVKKALTPIIDSYLQSHRIFGDENLVRIHRSARLQNALINAGCGKVTVGKHVFFGYNVCLLTGSHDITKFGKERKQAVPAGGHDIVIHDGAWISTNAIILGPCEIGENAVVAAGSVVTRDVPAGHVVAGNPARILRRIEAPEDSGAEH